MRSILILIAIAIEGSPSDLKMVVNTHRHGIRNPEAILPYLPNWINPLLINELTAAGMRQEYLAGKYARLSYPSFIPKAFDPAKILIQSTDTNRTILSAYCQSFGLFTYSQQINDTQINSSDPPVVNDLSEIKAKLGSNITANNFLPSVIKVVPIKYDTLLAPDWEVCDFYFEVQNSVYQTMEWQNLTKSFKNDYLPSIADLFSFNKDLVEEDSYIDLLDAIICAHYNSYITLGSVHLQSFQNIFGLLMSMKYVGPPSMNYTLAKIGCSNVLNDIVRKFNKKIEDDSYDLLYVEYSFHDTNIMYILYTLKLILFGTYIPFGSNIFFELHTNGSEYSVMMKFNGVKLLDMPFKKFEEVVRYSVYSEEQWDRL